MLKRAAYSHSVTADSALLCSCISLHHFRAAQRQDKEHTALLVSASLHYGTPQGTNGATSAPYARRLMMSGNMPSPARLMRSRARRCLVPAGGYRTIRRGLLWAVTKCFSVSYRVTPTTDLCILFLLAVSNHSPAVWFIQTASVIAVKCSA